MKDYAEVLRKHYGPGDGHGRIDQDDVISREKTLNEAILLLGNIRDQVDVLDRILLSLSSVCVSCGRKRTLPPELNGLCDSCEMSL